MQSFVISHNIWTGRASVEEAIASIRVEEEMQIEEWGMVEGGHDLERADLRARLTACTVMLDLIREHADALPEVVVQKADA